MTLQARGSAKTLISNSIPTQLAIHLLRRYANVEFRPPKLRSLSPRLRRMMNEFIDQNSSEHITLEDLAGLAGSSSYHFTRKFKADLGMAPHAMFVAAHR